MDEPQQNQWDGYIHLANGKLLNSKTFDEVHDDDLNVMTSFIDNFEQDLDQQMFSGEPIAVVQRMGRPAQYEDSDYQQTEEPPVNFQPTETYGETQEAEEWVNKNVL